MIVEGKLLLDDEILLSYSPKRGLPLSGITSPSATGLMSGALWADPWPSLAFTQAQPRAEVAGTGG